MFFYFLLREVFFYLDFLDSLNFLFGFEGFSDGIFGHEGGDFAPKVGFSGIHTCIHSLNASLCNYGVYHVELQEIGYVLSLGLLYGFNQDLRF
jgi:hypothetical protein